MPVVYAVSGLIRLLLYRTRYCIHDRHDQSADRLRNNNMKCHSLMERLQLAPLDQRTDRRADDRESELAISRASRPTFLHARLKGCHLYDICKIRVVPNTSSIATSFKKSFLTSSAMDFLIHTKVTSNFLPSFPSGAGAFSVTSLGHFLGRSVGRSGEIMVDGISRISEFGGKNRPSREGEDCCSFLSPVCFSGEKCLAAAGRAK